MSDMSEQWAPLTRYAQFQARDPAGFAAAIETERDRFGIILDQMLEACDYTPPHGTVDILSPGCGMSIEAPVLVDRFGTRQTPSRQVNITGIDLDISRRSTEIAREQTVDLPGNHVFLDGDASNLSKYPEIPKKVDVVLFRRQNYALDPPKWERLFTESLRRLRVGGVALMTSLNEYEHRHALRVVGNLGYKPLRALPELTPYSRESEDTTEQTVSMPIDMYMSVFRKHPRQLLRSHLR